MFFYSFCSPLFLLYFYSNFPPPSKLLNSHSSCFFNVLPLHLILSFPSLHSPSKAAACLSSFLSNFCFIAYFCLLLATLACLPPSTTHRPVLCSPSSFIHVTHPFCFRTYSSSHTNIPTSLPAQYPCSNSSQPFCFSQATVGNTILAMNSYT